MSALLTHRQYLCVAVPFIFSTITQPLLGAVDTAVIGHLSSVEAIGGIAVGTVIMNTLYWLFGFFRVSTTGQSAIALGMNDPVEKTATLVRPICLALGVGVVFIMFRTLIWNGAQIVSNAPLGVLSQAQIYFSILIWGAPLVLMNYTLVGWLMGQALVKETLYTQILGNLINIVLDVILVVGFNQGIGGVAAATLFSQGFTFALGVYLVISRGKADLKTNIPRVSFTKKEVTAIISANIDLMVRTVCILVVFNLMVRFGAFIGETALAANAVLMQLTFIISYLFDGIANSSSVFAGKAVGGGNISLLRLSFKRNFQWTWAAIVAITGILFFGGNNFAGMFTDMEKVVDACGDVLGFVYAFPLAAGFGLTLYGIFTGTNTTGPIRNSSVMAMVVFLAAALILVRWFDNHGLWCAFILFYVGRTLFLLPFKNRVEGKITNAVIPSLPNQSL